MPATAHRPERQPRHVRVRALLGTVSQSARGAHNTGLDDVPGHHGRSHCNGSGWGDGRLGALNCGLCGALGVGHEPPEPCIRLRAEFVRQSLVRGRPQLLCGHLRVGGRRRRPDPLCKGAAGGGGVLFGYCPCGPPQLRRVPACVDENAALGPRLTGERRDGLAAEGGGEESDLFAQLGRRCVSVLRSGAWPRRPAWPWRPAVVVPAWPAGRTRWSARR